MMKRTRDASRGLAAGRDPARPNLPLFNHLIQGGPTPAAPEATDTR